MFAGEAAVESMDWSPVGFAPICAPAQFNARSLLNPTFCPAQLCANGVAHRHW
jgi:hypothetical protein